MGWPTDIRLSPKLYIRLFSDAELRGKMISWAKDALTDSGNQADIEYRLGDLAWFFVQEGPFLTRNISGTDYPDPIHITPDEAQEWIDILDNHFAKYRKHREELEDAIQDALRNGTEIELSVTHRRRWGRPRISDRAGKKKIEIRSPRRPHKFHSAPGSN